MLTGFRSSVVRYLGFLVMLALCSATLATSGAVAIQACESVCGSSALCETECWYAPDPESEMIPTTCGEYDGGASNGWCDGDTCVALCDSNAFCQWGCYYEGQPSSCGEYGLCTLICGDALCSPAIGENPGTCPDDCGECGDGQCSAFWGENDPADGRYCHADCAPLTGWTACAECDPTDQDCASNEVCNAAQCCHPVSAICAQFGYCTSNSQCCGNEVCIRPEESWGIGYCGSREGAEGTKAP